MGWTITTAPSSGGLGTRTTYTLTVPGLGLGGLETLNKASSSDAFTAGDVAGVSARTSAGELWKNFGTYLHPTTSGVVVETTSAAGFPTFQARRMQAYGIGSDLSAFDITALYSSKSQQAITGIVSVSSGAESWVNGNVIYAYDSAGTALYTKVVATANASTGKRYILGRCRVIDPQVAGNYIVSLEYYGPTNFSSGLGLTPTYALPAGSGLGDIIYSDADRTVFSTTSSNAFPSQMGTLVAATGTGGAALMAVTNLGSQTVNVLDAVLSLSGAVTEISRYHGTPSLGFGPVYQSFMWSTAKYVSLPTISFDELVVTLPILGYRQALSQPTDCLDFAMNVTLPAPVGACRIVYSQGIPCICKATSDTAAPYVGALVNLLTRPQESMTFNENHTTGTAVRVSLSDAIPYPLRPFVSSLQTTNTQYGAVSWETLPTGTQQFSVLVSLGTGPSLITSAEASWAYYDCVSGVYINTGVTALTLNSATPNCELFGSLPAPVLPTGYLVGSWIVQYREFRGSWGAWTNGGRVYSTTQVGLPSYPFAIQVPPWLVADVDCTPVSCVGWLQAAKVTIGTPSWAGGVSLAWSANTITPTDTLVPTLTATAMYGVPHATGKRLVYLYTTDAPHPIGYNLDTEAGLFYRNQRPAGSTIMHYQIAKQVPVPHAAHVLTLTGTFNTWTSNIFGGAITPQTCVIGTLRFVDLTIP